MDTRKEPYLFGRFPRLAEKIPWMPLGSFPTPVCKMEKLGQKLGCSDLYIKKDDLSGEEYGGNKVRKLEFILADAVRRRSGPVITVGAVGSNHVLATTIYAKKAGLGTVGIFVPQPVQENLRDNILCNGMMGCEIEPVGGFGGAILAAGKVYVREWIKSGRRPYMLGPGGSSTLGVIGYVEAAFEIATQIESGVMPEPEFVFAPIGSGGTFAGLALGLKLAGLASQPVGVRVVDKFMATEKRMAHMANKALQYLRKIDPSIPNAETAPEEIHIEHDYFGAGYAHYTKKGVDAIKEAAELEGIKLEGTYSGKNMAAFMDFMGVPARSKSRGLFLSTYNSRPLDEMLRECPGPEILPESIRDYFTRDIHPVDG